MVFGIFEVLILALYYLLCSALKGSFSSEIIALFMPIFINMIKFLIALIFVNYVYYKKE